MTKRTPETAQGGSDRLTARERKCLENVRQDTGASLALRSLAEAARLTEQQCIAIFVEFVWGPVDFQNAKGKPNPKPEEIKRIVKPILKAAWMIQRLNTASSWGATRPAKWHCRMPEYPREIKATERAFEDLPSTLKMYAQSLSIKAERMIFSPKAYRKMRHRMEAALHQRILSLTGKRHRADVAAILCILNPMAGHREVQGESFRKREQRARRKRAQLARAQA